MRAHVLVILIVATLAGHAASAFHQGDLPLLAQVAGEGTGWVAFRVLVGENGRATYDYVMERSGDFVVSGSGEFWADGRPLSSHAGGGATGIAARASFGTPAGGTGLETPPLFSEGNQLYGSGMGPGEWILVLWSAGDVATWSAAVHGTDATVLATTSGNEAFVIRSHEFDSSTSAAVEMGTSGARATFDASRSMTIHHGFVGIFWAGAETEAASVETESGLRECGCWFQGPQGEGAPGEYRFSLEGASTGWSAVLMGADVRFP